MTATSPAWTFALLAVAGAGTTAALAAGTTLFKPDASMERAAVPEGYRWKLDGLFKDDAAFLEALTASAAEVEAVAAHKGKLADPAVLRTALDAYFKARLNLNRITLYANLRQDSATKDPTALGNNERAQKAMASFQAATSFIRQEVLAIPDATLDAALKADPALNAYRPYLDEFRRRKSRVLSADGERVLALAGDNLWAEIDLNEIPSEHEKTFHAALSDMPLPKVKDAAGQDVQVTLANYPGLRANADRRVRADTVSALFGTLRQFQDVYASTLAGQVGFNIMLARSRGYSTALEAYLDKDNIDPAVYKNLVSSIRANLKPLHRYVELRKKVMGLPELRIHDLYTPLLKGAETVFSWEESVRILPDALAVLGPDYAKALKAGLAPGAGWVDVYPHKDKASGAFCASVFGQHPYVKLNHLNDFDGLSTLAHEFGHAMHSHLSMTHQPYVTSGYVPFIAEIASTFNEKLLSDHLLKKARTPAEKLAILTKLVESIRTTIYRQALFADFELSIHTAAENGTPLTAQFLSKTYGDLVAAYYGPAFTLGPDDGMEWAYIPHFYYKYYVFSYATGLSSGIALAEKVQSGGPKARDAYLGMLKGGSSKPPLQLLKDAGVDLTRPEAVEAAARLMDRTLAEMEKLLATPPRN